MNEHPVTKFHPVRLRFRRLNIYIALFSRGVFGGKSGRCRGTTGEPEEIPS
jgi:hypothetical protein